MEQVQTVLGPVEPSTLGRTLTHEHLSLDFNKFYNEPPKQIKQFLDNKIALDNVGFVQRYPYSSYDNISFCDTETEAGVLYDLEIYKQLGGGCIVENTTYGIGRQADKLLDYSKKSGVHVIAGTGFYVGTSHPQSVLSYTTEEMYQIIKKDITFGTPECSTVRCGLIGEVGSNYPLNDFEVRSIQATAAVQKELRCPVSFHPGRDRDAPFEIMRKHCEAGGIVEKTVMSHLERTLSKIDDFLSFLDEFGSYGQLDLFGTEVLTYQFNVDLQMPSDRQRIDIVKELIESGHRERILLAHDIHTKHRLLKFGGHGFCHIFTNVVPKMLFCGIKQEDVDQITIENPKNWLKWVLPA